MGKRVRYIIYCSILLGILAGLAFPTDDQHQPIIPNLPSSPTLSVSTIPANGDVNPYGVAFVPDDFVKKGSLLPGDILVSNFNNSSNTQGTGSTIVDVHPDGQASLFFQGASELGLTTALGVLHRGFVIVGSLPSPTGACTQSGSEEQGVEQGSMLVLDSGGNMVTSLSDATLLDGPWDLTVFDEGENVTVFVSNVLSGTVTRLELNVPNTGGNLVVQSAVQIASGYTHRCDPAALVVGPTGLAYDHVKDILYVASTGDNAIFSIPHARRTQADAGMGTLIYQDNVHLHGPLALALAPNGDLLTADGDAVNPDPNQPSEIVEFTPGGQFVAQFSVDSAPGSAFGLAVTTHGNTVRFANVDDGLNLLDVWTIE
jgi:hypothetical protein